MTGQKNQEKVGRLVQDRWTACNYTRDIPYGNSDVQIGSKQHNFIDKKIYANRDDRKGIWMSVGDQEEGLGMSVWEMHWDQVGDNYEGAIWDSGHT